MFELNHAIFKKSGIKTFLTHGLSVVLLSGSAFMMTAGADPIPGEKTRLSQIHSFSVNDHQDIWSMGTEKPETDLPVFLRMSLQEEKRIPKDNPADAVINLQCLHRSCSVIKAVIVDRQTKNPVWSTEVAVYEGYFKERDTRTIAKMITDRLAVAYLQDRQQPQPVPNQMETHRTDRWWHWW